MDRRLKLHEELCDILGSRNVYFQPPESLKLKYPCIIYDRAHGDTQFADDRPYTFEMSYDLTLVDEDPDSNLIEDIASHFSMCVHDNHFTVDNLNHDVFRIYY